MSLEWYRSLDEIIGPFENLVEIDRSRLLGADFQPHLDEWSTRSDHEYWTWNSITNEDTSGRSPAAQKANFQEFETKAPETVLRIISEALLLPGLPSDYHFALMQAFSALWQMRRDDPTINAAVEKLCLLDIRLVEANPKAVQMGNEPDSFLAVPAFHSLISLYREEGYLAEALVVAEKANRFAPCKDIEELRQRIAVLEAEDA